MRKYSALQKVLALTLTLVMVIGLLPNITLPAEAAGEQASLTVSGKIADPQTLDNWQDYYGDNSLLPDGTRGTSTWKAGGVWTDKSVFTDSSAFPGSVVMDDQNDFLVSLSALASNKEIVGQSTAPTDTMLVLDLSNSMDTSRSVPGMVSAANDAIHALMKMNANNRVGVVLYSGNTSTSKPAYASSATVILPLDHYTTTTTSGYGQNVKYQYLSYSGSNNDTTVSVAAGTLNSDKENPKSSKQTNGSTYIQNGLYQAYEQFAGKTDKGVVSSGAQTGTQRTPILILMSDGAPTIATTDYYDVETSDTGNGGSTTNRITFLTQLTAAWVKGSVAAHYNNTTPKFYSVGLGTANNENATAVLNPTVSNNTLKDYWNSFNSGDTDDESVTIRSGQSNFALTYKAVAETVGINYVDQYWSASNSDGMIAAFQQIVDEIGLQSAYSATLVESGDADLDGYITVEDELGAMMVVKDIKGILLGDTLFTGAELASHMTEVHAGTVENATEFGNELVRTVKERLGITDTSVAQQLINSAYQSGQLSYTSASDYSNYIGWYGDEDNAYLGFWEESYGYGMESAPSDAKYINKSYGYLGAISGEEDAPDMMHIVVMVHTEIATGHQTVLFKVPSSLIPMITYKVELEGEAMVDGAAATLTVEETDPIRLVYEVGLPSDVNNVNLEQKVAEHLAKGGNHIHENADGTYTFYANSWDDNHDGTAPDIDDPGYTDAQKQALTSHVAESHFIPNTANERFYVLEDSLVYDANKNPVTNVTPGGTYYFVRPIVTVTGANGAANVTNQYEVLSAATVANSANFQTNSEGYVEVKAGTIRQTLSSLALPKDPNETNTLPDSDNLWVYVPGDAASDYNVYSFLGNNGKLTVAPATGIKVTKDVTEFAAGHDASTKFAITVTLSQAEAGAVVTDADGKALPAGTWTTADNKVFNLSLADGETVYITGLTAGTEYNVTEQTDKYTPDYTYENSEHKTVANVIQGVTVTNDPIKPGNLYITKEVKHANDGEAFPTDYEFDFEVTFLDKNGAPIAETKFKLENNYDASITELTTDANGVMKGKLRHGETVYIKEIPAGATVTVKEVNIPDNYTATAYSSINQSGETPDNDGVVTIMAEANATVVVTNTYTPKATSVNMDLTIEKTLRVDTQPSEGMSFDFEVEKWNGTTWERVVNDEMSWLAAQIDPSKDNVQTHNIDAVSLGTFTEAGTYTYRVYEVYPEESERLAGMTYDRTVYTLVVTVTDVNGQLVAVVTDNKNQTVADTDSDGKLEYKASFTNVEHAAPVSMEITKDVDDASNNPLITEAGYQFVAKEAQVDGDNWAAKENGAELTVVSDNQGKARLTATYKEPGSYYFLVSEVAPNPVPAGWTFSDKVYKVEVKVTKADNGDLSATLIIDGVDQNKDNASITFENKYAPTPATVPVDATAIVKKDLVGRDLEAGEFNFAIFKDGEAEFDANGNVTNIEDAIATATNDADGNVYFDNTAADGVENKLTFAQVGTYKYDIVEVKGALAGVTYDPTIYDLVVEVTDNGDGTLKANYYFEDSVATQVTIKNTYEATPAGAVIDGKKVLTVNSGYKALNAGDYTFALYATDAEGNVVGEPLQTTKNLANGTFAFEAISYDAVGTYTYVVKEIIPAGATENQDGTFSLNGVTYSNASFKVTVTVTDDKQKGALIADVAGDGPDALKVENKYSSKNTSVTLTGVKSLDNRTLKDREFKFAVYSADSTFTDRTLIKDDITHNESGNLSFSFTGLGMGYHYYVIKEVIPEEDARAAGIGYDANEYHVTIQVTDAGAGQMSAITTIRHTGDPNVSIGTNDIDFVNVYRPEDGSFVISGTKQYNAGLTAADGSKTIGTDEFEVVLYKGGEEVETVSVATDGTFSFSPITVTADDIGTDITYTVKEKAGTDNKVTYDDTEFTVKVTVKDDNKDGALEITKTVTKKDGANDVAADLKFTNTYTPEKIPYELKAQKEYTKELTGGEFTFELEGKINGEDVGHSVKNAAGGVVTFNKLYFDRAGTYTFTVKEIEKTLGFISYSNAEYKVTIQVVNNNGVLSVVEPVTIEKVKGADSESNLTFINEYQYIKDGEIILSGTKTIGGFRNKVKEGEFSFGLYDSEGKLIGETVKNDAQGNFAFPKLSYTEEDVGKTFTYTVKEIRPVVGEVEQTTYKGMTYDTDVYTVVVKVTDGGEGNVVTSYTVNGKADTPIAFENQYNVTDAKVTLEATKTYDKPLKGEDFTFTLEGNIDGTAVSQAKTNDKDGKIKFDQLIFTKEGTYTFKVKEKDELLGFITYSTAVYTVTVEVKDNGEGALIATVKVNDKADGKIAFENTYKMVDADNELTLSGTKTLTGRTLADKEFSFGLYDSEGKLIEKVANAADGSFAFTKLTYQVKKNEVQNYTYTVKEIAGNDPCVTYDATVYTVKVTVKDNGKGEAVLSYTINDKADGAIAFANTYTAPESVVAQIDIQKKVVNKTESGVGLDGFTFQLQNGDQTITVNSDTNGKASFQLTFTADEIGKTFEYKVSEKAGKTAGMTYDKTVHTIKAKVEQNADGSLKLLINDKEADKVEVSFTNTYEKPANPVTGDTFPVFLLGALMLISVAGITALMLTKRRKGGKYAK